MFQMRTLSCQGGVTCQGHMQIGDRTKTGKVVKLLTHNLLLFFEVQLTYNVGLIFTVQQNDSVMHTYLHIHTHTYSFSHSFPAWFIMDVEYSSLCYTVGPCGFSILYNNRLHLLTPDSHPSPPAMAITSLFSMSLILFLIHRQVHLLCFRFYV